jgi:hypothetical protein
MYVMFINDRPVAVSEKNLFDSSSQRYREFQELASKRGMTWPDKHRMESGSTHYDLTFTQTKLFATHESFDTRFYDLMFWLGGQDTGRDVLKNFV